MYVIIKLKGQFCNFMTLISNIMSLRNVWSELGTFSYILNFYFLWVRNHSSWVCST